MPAKVLALFGEGFSSDVVRLPTPAAHQEPGPVRGVPDSHVRMAGERDQSRDSLARANALRIAFWITR